METATKTDRPTKTDRRPTDRPRADVLQPRAGVLAVSVLGSELVWRTKPLAREQAERCQRMLEDNPLFAGATLESTGQGRFYVAFVPASPAFRQAMRERFQGQRSQRAEEARWWEMERLTASVDLVRTAHLNEHTGEVEFHEYEVSEEACTCPDWQYRCSKVGARCKHQEWRRSQGLGLGLPTSCRADGLGSPTSAAHGLGTASFTVPPLQSSSLHTQTEVCIYCNGNGERVLWRRCETCEGAAEVRKVSGHDRHGNPYWDWGWCDDCDGRGGADVVSSCEHCDGVGEVLSPCADQRGEVLSPSAPREVMQ